MAEFNDPLFGENRDKKKREFVFFRRRIITVWNMDLAYLHIVTNHIPIIGVPFALTILLLGFWRRSDELKAVGLLAFVVLGGATLAVYLLGQGGEDFVEDLAGVSENAIEDHEKMGLVSLIAVGLTALVSLSGLIFYKGSSLLLNRGKKDGTSDGGSIFPGWLVLTVLGLAVLSGGILGYAGKLGGKIRHTEFYGGAISADERERNGGGKDAEAGQIDEERDEGDGKGGGRRRRGRN